VSTANPKPIPRRTTDMTPKAILLLALCVTACSSNNVVSAPPKTRTRTETLGSGPPLRYLVLGDSTTVAEGGSYDRGIVLETARHLARGRSVEVINVGVTGARMADVRREQLPRASGLRADLVLIDAGANDITHLTPSASIERDLVAIIETLLDENCKTRIVVTGSPDMGAPPRIPFLLRGLAGFRSRRLNVMAQRTVTRYNLTFAPIADRTGPLFRSDRTLFAADRFHPNDRGYATWIPVLNEALDSALTKQPDHCSK